MEEDLIDCLSTWNLLSRVCYIEEGRRFGWMSIQQILQHSVTRLGSSNWNKCQANGRCSRGLIWRHSRQPDYCAIPSAMQATGKASCPGHAHYRRAGAPTRRITARRTKKAGKNKIVVNGRCLTLRESLKSQPHGVQRAERPQLRSHCPGGSVGTKLGYCSLTAIQTTSKTISAPGAKTCSVPRPPCTSRLIILISSSYSAKKILRCNY